MSEEKNSISKIRAIELIKIAFEKGKQNVPDYALEEWLKKIKLMK